MGSTTKLAFQPWARNNSEITALKDTLARVNFERGHFRDINEATLLEEITQDGILDLSESEDGQDEEGELEDSEAVNSKPQTREDLYKARFEMLQYVAAAEQDILLALDFVSMLQSKDAPTRSVTTISRDLKNAIPVGSLGTDIWQRVPIDKAREAQAEMLATNVRMEGLQNSADGILAAAKRLKDNVRKETQYWDQILSISEKGWNICRLPQQKHKLGVTFGFSESAPQFSRRGIAALGIDSEGNILLERGVGRKTKALRVVLKKAGNTIGVSKVPVPADERETTLETRIRHARDNLFDEELYHELLRESRSMASMGVSVTAEGIEYQPDTTIDPEGMQVLIELISTDDTDFTTSYPEDNFAQAAILAARLLLSEAHRSRLKKRGEIPAPLSDRKDEKPLLPILRPLISFMLHRSALTQVNTYLKGLEASLSSADIHVNIEQGHFQLPEISDIGSAESLITTLLRAWTSDAQLQVADSHGKSYSIGLKIESTLSDGSGSIVEVKMPNGRSIRFGNFEEARIAADTCVASGLAQALANTLTGDWKCDPREASLTKPENDDDKRATLWVEVDSHRQMLSLRSPTSKVSWTASGGGVAPASFWSAWQDLSKSSTYI